MIVFDYIRLISDKQVNYLALSLSRTPTERQNNDFIFKVIIFYDYGYLPQNISTCDEALYVTTFNAKYRFIQSYCAPCKPTTFHRYKPRTVLSPQVFLKL